MIMKTQLPEPENRASRERLPTGAAAGELRTDAHQGTAGKGQSEPGCRAHSRPLLDLALDTAGQGTREEAADQDAQDLEGAGSS